MKENSIIQFVCFETPLTLDIFVSQWESYAKRFFKQDIHAISLQEQVAKKAKFKYISKNEWPQDNFQFSFMEGRLSDHFPDSQVKEVQAGGYTPTQIECDDNPGSEEVKVMVFLHAENPDLVALKKLPYRSLNIYEPFYQNCMYAYILEFYTEEINAADLIQQLKNQFLHAETGAYKECLVLEG